MTEPALLTTGEAAEVLRVPARTIIRWARDGKLPVAQKLPGETGTYLFTREAIDAKAIERRAQVLASVPDVPASEQKAG